jgi:hypothetical protein
VNRSEKNFDCTDFFCNAGTQSLLLSRAHVVDHILLGHAEYSASATGPAISLTIINASQLAPIQCASSRESTSGEDHAN